MNKLKAYVKRTILASAKEQTACTRGVRKANGGRMYTPSEARAEGLRIAFTDATRGVNTGWWADLIYTADVYRMADANRKAIADALEAYRSEAGDGYTAPNSDGRDEEAILQACINAPTFAYWAAHTDQYECRTEALMHGLKFAVKWYAQELASEMGVEL
jgi:hypothetical protein